MDHSAAIRMILEERQRHLPRLERLLASWDEIRQLTTRLQIDIAKVLEHGVVDADVTESARRISPEFVAPDIDRVESAVRSAITRFRRVTVNIGVSGAARVGKSTLLQSISGLGDAQIPTGKGLPVTAVRSQIFHSVENDSALVTFHTWESFRDQVVEPLHSSLGMATTSLPTPAAWRSVSYEGLEPSGDNEGDFGSDLARVRDLQADLSTYEDLLGQGPRLVGLDELRPYVAYPTPAEVDQGTAIRKYAAVRSARIDCPFPQRGVEGLGLVDLPGLGEIDPGAEAHHVASLKDEVDLVVLVKRPDPQTSYWGKQDSNAFKLVQRALGGSVTSDHYCMLLVNSGSADPDLREALLAHLRSNAPKVHIEEVDAASAEDVSQVAVPKMLAHLADHLAASDRVLVEEVTRESHALAQRLAAELAQLGARLQAPKLTGSAEERLHELAEATHLSIAGELFELVEELFEAIRQPDQGSTFIERVDACYEAARQWIDTEAFGEGDDVRLLNRMRKAMAATGVGSEELNRLRVEISDYFSDIDTHFAAEVQSVAGAVRQVLLKNLPGVLDPSDDALADLRSLADRFEYAEEPAPMLAASLRELCGVSFSFRTHLYPEVRDIIRTLLQWEYLDEASGELRPLTIVSLDPAGAERMIEELKSQARKVAYQSKKELISRAETPAKLSHAVAEHFADRAVRHKDASREFHRIARSYRFTIWQGEFEQFISSAQLSTDLRSTHKRLVEALRDLEGLHD